MGKKNRSLDHSAKKDHIENHLFSELCYLLDAATEWSVQERLKLEIEGYEVQVYALDSACLHARSLFEFFTEGPSKDCFGADLRSASYKKSWRRPLQAFLMHVRDRSSPKQLQTADGPNDLNRMPVYFANEILGLWKEFEDRLGQGDNPGDRELQKVASEKRKQAIGRAQCFVSSEVARLHAERKGQQLKPVFVC